MPDQDDIIDLRNRLALAERRLAESARVEEALRESEELRRIAIEGGGMGTWRWNIRDGLVWGDAAFLDLWGYPPSDEARQLSDFTERMSLQGQAEVGEITSRAITAGEEFDGQLAVVGGPNVGRWIRWRGRAERKRPEIVNGVSFDITAQQLVDEQSRESTEELRHTIEYNPQITWTASPDGHIHMSSDRWAAWTGSHGFGEEWHEVQHPDDFPAMYEKWMHGVRTGEAVDIEHRTRIALDGSYRWMRSRAYPRRNEHGEIIKWYGTTEDIHERKLAREALRESEMRFQQFAQASSAGLWIRDAGTLTMEYVSPAISVIYGMEPNGLLGEVTRWKALILPEDRDVARQHLEQARQGETVVHEFRIRRRSDQAVRWVRNTDFPLYSGEHIQRIGGIAEDITKAKLVQQELEHSDERLRSAVEVGRIGLWDWNVTTSEVHWSDENYRMNGYAPGEVKPSYDLWVSKIHADDRAATKAALDHARTQHREYVWDYRAVLRDGSIHWHSARGRFRYDEDGVPVRMIGAIIDVTERREWEERQKVLVAELQHRTRNLMGVVRSMSDKTARASTDLPDFRARFRTRLEALSRVQGLLSRLEDHDRVTFDDLIRTELAVMAGIADRVTLSGPNGIRLRSSTVQTLAMALHELTTNAMKYGALGQPAGRLAITWSLQPNSKSEKPWLHVDWRESGVTMPPSGAGPQGTGQGRELIEKALPYQLRAETTYMLGPDGVHCTISIPVSASSGEIEEHG